MVDERERREGRGESAAPSRVVALFLNLCTAPGVGHFYLGHTARALAWVVVPLLLLGAYLAALVRVPALYGTFLLVVGCGAVGVRLAVLLDVFLVPTARFRRARWLHVGLFLLGAVGFQVLGSMLLRSRVAEAFKIPGGGMQPALSIQDHILVDKAAFHGALPARGSLAVFVSPESPRLDYIKRVVALPGDRLEVVDGRPWINGWEVPHCVVGQAALPDQPEDAGQLELEYLGGAPFLIFLASDRKEGRQGPYVVKPGEVWVLGDNRNNSADSRYWFGGEGGGVPHEDLKGRPLFTWLAFKANGYPEWSRMGVSLEEARLPPNLATLQPALQSCLSKRPATTSPPDSASAL